MTTSGAERPLHRYGLACCVSCTGLHLADLWHDIVSGARHVTTHTTCPHCAGGLRVAPSSDAQSKAG
jgi:hypothetical protein